MSANLGAEIVRIMAPLIENPNAPDNDGVTPIHLAAWFGLSVIHICVPTRTLYRSYAV